MFLDIERDTQRLQVMVELKKLTPSDGVEHSYKDFKKVARTGDWICECHVTLQISTINRRSCHR